MRTSIIIERRHQKQDGTAHYVVTASGKFGGGYTRHIDCDLEQIAATACSAMLQYAQSNSEGGDLVAPADVLALVPAHLHNIPAKS